MATENDKLIQQLSKIVEEKKAEISKIEKKPTWLTNCAFRYSEDTSKVLNLNTVSDTSKLVSALSLLLSKQGEYDKACELLGVNNEGFKWFGYSVEDWVTDFKTRIGKIELTSKKKELAEIEAVLENKLSKELKDKLELEAIQKKLLGNG